VVSPIKIVRRGPVNVSVMSQSIKDDDWRLRGQERYLAHAQLFWRVWSQRHPDWDHDHCAFCWAKFAVFEAPDIQHEAYTTADDFHWVCAEWARDFASRFNSTLVGGPAAT